MSASDTEADTVLGVDTGERFEDACAAWISDLSCRSSVAISARQGASFAAFPPWLAAMAGVAATPAAAGRGDQPVLIARPRYRMSMLARPADTPRKRSAAATCAQTGTARHHCGLRAAACPLSVVDCGLWIVKPGCGGDQCPS